MSTLIVSLITVLVVVSIVGFFLYRARKHESYVGARWPTRPHPGNFVQWLEQQPNKTGVIYIKGGRSNEMCSNRGNHLMCGGEKPGWMSNPPTGLRVTKTASLSGNRIRVAIYGDNNESLDVGVAKMCTSIQKQSDNGDKGDRKIGCIISPENYSKGLPGPRGTEVRLQDFVIEDIGNGKISIRTWLSGADKYCADDADGIRCNRTGLGDWERFIWSPAN